MRANSLSIFRQASCQFAFIFQDKKSGMNSEVAEREEKEQGEGEGDGRRETGFLGERENKDVLSSLTISRHSIDETGVTTRLRAENTIVHL